MTALATATLSSLGDRAVVPSYDRERVVPGVVHLGMGGFHRAHAAMYLDRLMEETGQLDWGVCGVGMLPGDNALQEALAAQDHLYTVIEKSGDGGQALRVIGAVVEHLLAPADPEAVVARMAARTTRIVSLTITEGGYAPVPQAGSAPATFGLLCAALRRRRDEGAPPFTIVSCDNLPGNGRLAREALLAHARREDPELAGWIADAVRFPSSMVDRITPATTDADRAQLAERHGIEDRWPVVCEPFSQWVLEDDFTDGRPPLERVGVQLVADVVPYELMKLRLLNGSHQALGYVGYLMGHRHVHEAAQDPLLERFVRGYLGEARPTLPPLPGIDLDDYEATLIERFANPEIRDTLARVCAYSSDRVPPFLLPVIRARLEAGGDVSRSAAAVAAWARYAEGVDEAGAPIDVVDARAEALTGRARRQRSDPTAFLQDREVFGDLADDDAFVTPYLQTLHSLHERGARATLEHLIGNPHG